MCIAVPAKIEKIDGNYALVNYGGVEMDINISFITEAKVNDYVLIHAGCAIEKVDEEEALETLKLYNEFASLLESR